MSRVAPLIIADLTPGQLQAVQQLDSVVRILPDKPVEHLMTVMLPAVSADTVWPDFTGAGARIAIVEDGAIADNPHLGSFVARPGTYTVSDHKTAVSGFARSQNVQHRGAAPDATLYDARASDATWSDVQAATDWAVAQGVHVINNSWGSFNDGEWQDDDVYLDWVSFYNRIAICTAAGNNNDGTGYVASPAIAYNVIAVGGVNPNNGDAFDMYVDSSWRNPESEGEKPEVVAPAQAGDWGFDGLLTEDPWYGTWWFAAGTSLACPIVAGIGGLIIDQTPGFADDPEVIKAILMTGGLHRNIEGDPTLSDRDGAGMATARCVYAGAAVRTVSSSSFDGSNEYVLNVGIPLTAGVRKRIVMVYGHQPQVQDPFFPDPFGDYDRCDLDLRLYVGGNLVFHAGDSERNAYEIIDYTPESDTTAEVRVYRWSWDTDIQNLRIGFAWASDSTLTNAPTRPTNLWPPNAQTGVPITTALQASAFDDRDVGDTHGASHWQVDDSPGFGSPAWDSGVASPGTQIQVPAGALSPNTVYYWRVRYRDNHGAWSDHSSPTWFRTAVGSPSDIVVTITQLQPNPANPYAPVAVSGTATYNNGSPVNGTGEITVASTSWTTPVLNGVFGRNITAPGTSATVFVAVSDGSLSGNTSAWLQVNPPPGGPYTLTTNVVYDYEGDDQYVQWWSKPAFRTTDEFVDILAVFDNINVDHDLDLTWRFYKPDGSQYGTDLFWPDAIQSDWDWGWASWGFLIDGALMSYIPGRYQARFYVDGTLQASHYYTVAWDLTEHRMCRDVQSSSPFDPIGGTNEFTQQDVQAVTWCNFDLVAQSGDLRCRFYEPTGALYATVESGTHPTYHLADPGGPHTWWDWYRAWAWIGINGASAAQKCGPWRAEVSVRNPTTSAWELYYTDYFSIHEMPAVPPMVSVAAVPATPGDGDSIALNVQSSDNTYLQRIELNWYDGVWHSTVLADDIFAGTFTGSLRAYPKTCLIADISLRRGVAPGARRSRDGRGMH